MTKEDKQLLLQELCARLPYGVQCEGLYEEEADYSTPYNHTEKSIGLAEGVEHIGFDDGEVYVTIEGIPCELATVKLYLRPMSSMTEKEKKKFDDFCVIDEEAWKGNGLQGFINQSKIMSNGVKYLISRHLDYNGLIDKGLAIEAPVKMYKLK